MAGANACPLSAFRDCCLPSCITTRSLKISPLCLFPSRSTISRQLSSAHRCNTLSSRKGVLCEGSSRKPSSWHNLFFAFVTFFALLFSITFISYRAYWALFAAQLMLLNHLKIWFRTLLCSPVSLDRQIGNTIDTPCVAQTFHHACCDNTIRSAFAEGKYK